MRVVWIIDGPWYHDRKKEFTKARQKHGYGLVFKGFPTIGWKSEWEDINLDAERVVDPGTGEEYSKTVTITWEGEKATELFVWMKEFFEQWETNPLKEELKAFDAETEGQLKMWAETLNRPPEGYINAYKKDRAKKREEIMKAHNGEEMAEQKKPEVGRPREEVFDDDKMQETSER